MSETQEKRVVVYVVTGRRAGMRRIIGHLIFKPGDELPKKFENVFVCNGEDKRTMHLVGEFPRYVLYSEIAPKPVKRPRNPRPAKVIANDGASIA